MRLKIFEFLLYMVGTFVVVFIVQVTVDEKWDGIYNRFRSVVPTVSTLVATGMSMEIFEAMREGGYTIFIRHSKRDKHVVNMLAFERFALKFRGEEHPTFKEGSCLNEEGKAEAWLLGKIFEKAQSPIGSVYSSPICRAKETAQLAFGRVDVINPNLTYQFTNTRFLSNGSITKEEKKIVDENFRKLVYTPPQKGTNKVLVGHSGQFAGVGGFGWQKLEIAEGGVLILKHEPANQLTLITNATIEELVYALTHQIAPNQAQ